MNRRVARLFILAGVVLLLLLLAGGGAAHLYTDALWFEDLGHGAVLWTRIAATVVVRGAAGILCGAIVAANLLLVARHLGPVNLRRRYGNLEISEQIPRRYIHTGVAVIAIAAGWWLSGLLFPGDVSLAVVAALRRASWGLEDPVFQRDVSFFVFALPVYAQVLAFLLVTAIWSFVLTLVGYVLVGAVRFRNQRLEVDEPARLHFAVLLAGVVLLFGARYWLGRYGILLEGTGIGGGVGYTDIEARLPAHRVIALLSVGVAGALVYGAWRRTIWPPVTALGVLLVATLALGQAYPSIVQKLQVDPNQLAREEPYIRWNIDFTRTAYGLASLERQVFPYSGARLGSWDELEPALDRITLWDREPLRTVLQQRQTLFPYYLFPSVHDDRYGPPGDERPVAVAVREFVPEGLETDRQTFTTLHLDYDLARGAGAIVTPTDEKSGEGDPVYWLYDIVPLQRSASAPPGVQLDEPRVFYGETMEHYLIVQPEAFALDVLPGIPIGSFVRRAAFAWRFADRDLLFTGQLNEDSHVLFRRRVADRVQALAPFLVWDDEPLPVLRDGRLVWLIDGYSATATFPIARRSMLGGRRTVRYIRNSVKAAVDGVTGEVAFYAVEPDEPILATWQRVFPGLIQPLDAMPADLRAHLRYPSPLALLQADVLRSYHVDEPRVFFAGENEWQIPGETGPGAMASARPVYMLMRAPGEMSRSFWLVQPFIARQRPNMTSILLIRNDPDGYGRMLLLQLPRDQQVPGPTQVRSIIEADPGISERLSLWRAGGSMVELGRIRVLALDSSIAYVQPLFLTAGSGAVPIPQLKQVVVSDGTAVSMAETLPAAIDGLYGPASRRVMPPAAERVPSEEPSSWAADAMRLFEEAERYLREGNWAAFGETWNRLRAALEQAARERSGG